MESSQKRFPGRGTSLAQAARAASRDQARPSYAKRPDMTASRGSARKEVASPVKAHMPGVGKVIGTLGSSPAKGFTVVKDARLPKPGAMLPPRGR